MSSEDRKICYYSTISSIHFFSFGYCSNIKSFIFQHKITNPPCTASLLCRGIRLESLYRSSQYSSANHQEIRQICEHGLCLRRLLKGNRNLFEEILFKNLCLEAALTKSLSFCIQHLHALLRAISERNAYCLPLESNRTNFRVHISSLRLDTSTKV